MPIIDGEFWRLLAPRLDELREAKESALLEGQPDSYADYRDGVGYMRALADVKIAAQAVFDQLAGKEAPAAKQQEE